MKAIFDRAIAQCLQQVWNEGRLSGLEELDTTLFNMQYNAKNKAIRKVYKKVRDELKRLKVTR